MIKLDKDSFRTWLEQNKDGNVGHQNRPGDCAFARFLRSQGALEANVNGERIMYMKTSTYQYGGPLIDTERTPTWLSMFIHVFDVHVADPSNPSTMPGVKTGSFALRCLFHAELAIEAEEARTMQMMQSFKKITAETPMTGYEVNSAWNFWKNEAYATS